MNLAEEMSNFMSVMAGKVEGNKVKGLKMAGKA